LSATATALVSVVRAPAGVALGGETTAGGAAGLGDDAAGEFETDAGGEFGAGTDGEFDAGADAAAGFGAVDVAAEVTEAGGTGFGGATSAGELTTGAAGEDVDALIADAGRGVSSARWLTGRRGGVGRGGREARVGGFGMVFGRKLGGAACTFSVFSGATPSVTTTGAGGVSVAPVADAVTPESPTAVACESRATSTWGRSSRSAATLLRTTST